MDCLRSFHVPAASGAAHSRLALQGIGDEPADIVDPERGQHNLMQPRTSVTDQFKSPHQRMCRADLVVPVGPD